MREDGTDWCILFLKMAPGHGGRTARECEIKWMGDRRPSINHAQWSQPEISKCRDLVETYWTEHGHGTTVDWVWVAKELKVTSSEPFRYVIKVIHIRSDQQDTFGLYASWDCS